MCVSVCMYMSYDEKYLCNIFVSNSNLVALNSITYITYINICCYDSYYLSSDI